MCSVNSWAGQSLFWRFDFSWAIWVLVTHHWQLLLGTTVWQKNIDFFFTGAKSERPDT
jgi:hypothetical protein